jgi:hypothetical protein
MPQNPYSVTAVSPPTDGSQQTGVGPTAALSKDPYSLQQLRYPLEGIGTNDVPHYVVFNINLPESSKYLKNSNQAVANANIASVQNYNTLQSQGGVYAPVTTGQNLGGAILLTSGVTAIQSGGKAAAVAAAGGALGGTLLTTLNLKPKLVRIKQSIAIYMPDTIATQYTHTWGGVSATDAGGNIGKYAQIGGSFDDDKKIAKDLASTLSNNLFTHNPNKSFNAAQSGELGADLLSASGGVGPGFTDLTLKSIGAAVNPHVEMLFKQTENRQFQFDFHFIPRSQQESVAIANIIKTFKSFAAPEVSSEAGGRYFIPPAQFDISFYFMQAENQSIARISTCALTNINVNYAGAGSWTTFNDGSPLRIDVQLTFQEMAVITRELIDKYGY